MNRLGVVQGMSDTNFLGGRKPFPKPSAFESEIHPTHKTSFYAPGISPLQGANLRRRKFIQSERAGLYLSMLPKERTHGWRCCLRLHFGLNVQHRQWDFTERSPTLRLSESDS